jgi:SOUL heme-binding protein
MMEIGLVNRIVHKKHGKVPRWPRLLINILDYGNQTIHNQLQKVRLHLTKKGAPFEPIPTQVRIVSMTQTSKRTAFTIFAATIAALVNPMSAKAERVAEPPYTLVTRAGDFEIRDYQTQVIAEVSVTGARGDPANQGFRPLAGYIFGGNAPKAKIAMTAPVTRQQGTKIAMTAPVTRQAAGSAWKVRFIMPAGSTLATMPRPNDPSVRLLEEPGKRYGVIRFSGVGGDAVYARKTAELNEMLAARRLVPIGAPVIASYDPPWTLPFNRRNEVWLELAKPQ